MSYVQQLKNQGYRITNTRRSIIQLFEQAGKPLSAPAILKLLNKIGLDINKSTIYRELDFLLEINIIKKILLDHEKIYFELKNQKHHHHLVCNHCGTIEGIELEKEKNILKEAINKTNFQIENHTLEFFGTCPSCQ